jgi:hypothetical protein
MADRDILADARRWIAAEGLGETMGRSHDAECHERHLTCLVTRLADEIARLRDERRWISVGERLPDDLRRVMVMVPGLYGAQVAWLLKGKWYDGIGCGNEPIGCRVTHWMPLPPDR